MVPGVTVNFLLGLPVPTRKYFLITIVLLSQTINTTGEGQLDKDQDCHINLKPSQLTYRVQCT